MVLVDLPRCCPRSPIEIEAVACTGTVVTVAVRGEIDMDTGNHVEHTLLAALDAAPETLVVDLSGVTFLGSVGLRILVECQLMAEKSGRALVLGNVRPWVRQVLEMAGLREFFDVRATERA
ncbi:STAS domain-containing protein [Actinoplanes sp. DH11]|uniref:STAS domain-containing protein n=1 Tax=Actinoplanes sp. DH11 TaxID=2857011 RepID=UPI001E4CECAE|nr:STAS domain-containing protein [Actinoplanes sp. DH11]